MNATLDLLVKVLLIIFLVFAILELLGATNFS
jgi:hypothetical protein